MWYFTWILGVLLVVAVGIINVLWYEASQHLESIAEDERSKEVDEPAPPKTLLGKIFPWLQPRQKR